MQNSTLKILCNLDWVTPILEHDRDLALISVKNIHDIFRLQLVNLYSKNKMNCFYQSSKKATPEVYHPEVCILPLVYISWHNFSCFHFKAHFCPVCHSVYEVSEVSHTSRLMHVSRSDHGNSLINKPLDIPKLT